MCLAVPGKIIAVHDDMATTDMMGVEREVSLRLLPEAAVGDYVLVHAGFGIQLIDEAEAEESIQVIRDLDEMAHEDLASNRAAVPTA